MTDKIDPKTAEELAKATAATAAAAERAASSFEDQLEVILKMRDAMRQMAEIMAALGDKDYAALSPEKWKKMTKEVSNSRKELTGAQKASEELAKALKSKLVSAAIISTSALTGLRQGLKNLVAMSKAVTGLVSSLAGGLFSVGRSILAIPFKMMDGLINMAKKGAGGNELAAAYEEVRKEFGDLNSTSSKAITDTAKNMDKMNQTGIPTYKVFGTLAERIKAVKELAVGLGPMFSQFQDEIHANGTAIMMYQKGLGLSNEQMQSLATNAQRMGKGIAQVQNEMTKQSLGMSNAFGLNAKTISKDMGKAMQDLAHFGHLSSKEMAVTAAFAQKMGVSIDKLTGIMDATSTFDQTAEGMSKLNEQFGTNIDFTEMMSAQSPEEKVAMLSKEFAKTGKDLSKLTKQERDLIKSSAGVTDEVLNSMAAHGDMTGTLKELNKQAEKNENKTLSQADAMKDLSKSIERLTQSGSAGEGGIFAHIFKGFTTGIQSTKEFRTIMNNINKVLRIAFQFGMQLGNMFVKLFPGVKDVFEGIGELFSPERYKKLFGGVLKAFDVFKAGGTGKMEDFMENIKKAFFDFFDSGKGPGKKVLGGFGKFFEAAGIIFGKLSEWIVKKLAKGIEAITEFIRNPQVPKVAGGPGGSKIMGAFSGVLDAFVTKLLPALRDLGKLLWEKFVNFFKETIVGSTAGKVVIGGAIAAVLAPAIMGAFAGAGSGSLLKKAGGSLLGNAGGALKEAAGAERASRAANGVAAAATGPAAIAMGAVSKANEVIGGVLPQKEVIEKMKAASEVKVDFGQLMKFLAGLALVIGTGLLAMAGSIKLIRKMDITVKDMAMASALLLSMAPPMAAAGLLVIEANKVGQVAMKGLKETLAGLAAMGLVLVALGAAGAAMGAITKKIGASEMLAGAEALNIMANVFMKVGVIIAEAAAIGAGILLTAGAGAGFIVAGMTTMVLAVTTMANSAVDIMKSLAGIQGNPAELKLKTEAFASILSAISGMASSMGEILKQLNAGFVDYLFGDSTTKKVKKMKDFVKVLLNGEDGKGGIQGVIDSIMLGISGSLMGLGEAQLNALPAVTGMFKTIVDLVSTISKLASGGGNVDLKGNTGVVNIISQMPNVSEVVEALSKAAPNLLRRLVVLTDDIPTDKKFKNKLDVLNSIFETFSKVTNIITNATKGVEYNQGEGPIQAIGRQTKFLYNVLQVLAGEKMAGVPEAASLKDISELIKKVNVDNAAFKKAEDLVKTSEKLSALANAMSAIPDKMSNIKAAFDKMSGDAFKVNINGVGNSIKTVQEMVSKTQELDSALNNLPKINIAAKLDKISKGLGIGAKGVYTVESKPVVLHVEFNVTMDVDKVEKIIVTRQESVIRDRINFLLENTMKGNSQTSSAMIKSTGAQSGNVAPNAAP